jgi:hypothetical protein
LYPNGISDISRGGAVSRDEGHREAGDSAEDCRTDRVCRHDKQAVERSTDARGKLAVRQDARRALRSSIVVVDERQRPAWRRGDGGEAAVLSRHPEADAAFVRHRSLRRECSDADHEDDKRRRGAHGRFGSSHAQRRSELPVETEAQGARTRTIADHVRLLEASSLIVVSLFSRNEPRWRALQGRGLATDQLRSPRPTRLILANRLAWLIVSATVVEIVVACTRRFPG